MKETDAAAVADALPILMLLLPSPPTHANTDVSATDVNTATSAGTFDHALIAHICEGLHASARRAA